MRQTQYQPEQEYRGQISSGWRAENTGPVFAPADGLHRTKIFARKYEAQAWLEGQTAGMVAGTWVDPNAGRETFREYAEHWRSVQSHRPTTADQVERNLTRHVYPAIGDRPLATILPSDLKALVKTMGKTLAPSTVSVIYRHVSAIFKAGVADRRIAASPCSGVSVPEPRRARVVPVGIAEVQAVAYAITPRYRAAVILAAGTGMRLGEVLGLNVAQVNFLRRQVHVDRQLVQIAGQEPTFGPPKTNASYRTIPLPQMVVDEVAAHLAAYPARPDGLVFTNELGAPVRRTSLWKVWRTATTAAGVPDLTFHGLRHHYASLLIRHGESVKTVQERLGHESATETLDTYSHLWPDSDDRTREAIDGAWSEQVVSDSRQIGTS